MKILVIGCGGIGSYAAPLIAKTFPQARIIWQDGDEVEAKNIDRQYFTEKDIGEAKAGVLAERHGGIALLEWYDGEDLAADIVFVFVDNNKCRKRVLEARRLPQTMIIVAANETEDAMAVAITHENQFDALKAFPKWNDLTDGPLADGQSCTSVKVLTENPQTTLANFSAAQHAVMLAVAQQKARREVAGTLYLIQSTTNGIKLKKGDLHE